MRPLLLAQCAPTHMSIIGQPLAGRRHDEGRQEPSHASDALAASPAVFFRFHAGQRDGPRADADTRFEIPPPPSLPSLAGRFLSGAPSLARRHFQEINFVKKGMRKKKF